MNQTLCYPGKDKTDKSDWEIKLTRQTGKHTGRQTGKPKISSYQLNWLIMPFNHFSSLVFASSTVWFRPDTFQVCIFNREKFYHFFSLSLCSINIYHSNAVYKDKTFSIRLLRIVYIVFSRVPLMTSRQKIILYFSYVISMQLASRVFLKFSLLRSLFSFPRFPADSCHFIIITWYQAFFWYYFYFPHFVISIGDPGSVSNVSNWTVMWPAARIRQNNVITQHFYSWTNKIMPKRSFDDILYCFYAESDDSDAYSWTCLRSFPSRVRGPLKGNILNYSI